MDHVTIWPFAITIVILGICSIIYRYRSNLGKPPEEFPTKTEVPLSSCFTLSSQYYLRINGLLPERDNVQYENFIYRALFSRQGDVFLRRQFNGRNICWEKFSPNGKSLGLRKKSEVQNLLDEGALGRVLSFIIEPENGQVTVFLDI